MERPKLLVSIFTVAAVLILAVVVFIFLRASEKIDTAFGRIDLPQIDSQIGLQTKSISFNFKSSQEVAKIIKVYKFSNRPFPRKEAVEIAAGFGFKTKPKGKNILTWKGKKRTLVINLENSEIKYTDRSVKATQGNFSSKNLASKAKSFLNQRGLSTNNLKGDTENTQFLEIKGTELSPATSSSKPVFLQIGFNKEIDGLALFYASPETPPTSVLINNKGQLFSLTYRNSNIDSSKVGVYPVTKVEEINTDFIRRIGKLVFPTSGDNLFDTKLIRKITIEDYSLAYLDDQKNSHLVPIYVLRGFADVGTETTGLVIYFPAIKLEWLK